MSKSNASVRVVLTTRLYDRETPVPTKLHAFVRAAQSSEVDVISVVNGRPEAFLYDLGTDAIPAGGILGVDCFMQELNRNDVPCQQRVGSVSFGLRELYDAGERGVNLAMRHDSSRLEQGQIHCVATFASVTAASFLAAATTE